MNDLVRTISASLGDITDPINVTGEEIIEVVGKLATTRKSCGSRQKTLPHFRIIPSMRDLDQSSRSVHGIYGAHLVRFELEYCG
jgi:hypothetical protein